MRTIAFFLEEPSAKEMLEGVLPRLLRNEYFFRFVVFQGKQDLEKNLGKKLRSWLSPDTTFVVLRDQDAGNCLLIKKNLQQICSKSGKEKVLIRIACRELESFYLGDLAAVELGLGLEGLKKYQEKQKFREPDQLQSAAQELEKLTGGRYQKVAGSRLIAPHLNVSVNRSQSFLALLEGLRRILEEPA